MGVIVRTAGANKTKNEIEKDFQNTLKTWEEIKRKSSCFKCTLINLRRRRHNKESFKRYIR